MVLGWLAIGRTQTARKTLGQKEADTPNKMKADKNPPKEETCAHYSNCYITKVALKSEKKLKGTTGTDCVFSTIILLV